MKNRRLTIPCTKNKLESIRGFVSSVLKQYEFSEMETHKIILAVDEICANLIIHSNNCNASQFLEVDIIYDEKNELVFLIKDKGVSFDFTKYKEPEMDEIVSSKRKGGLGLMLVKRIMDKIEFTTENNYNICKLVKKL